MARLGAPGEVIGDVRRSEENRRVGGRLETGDDRQTDGVPRCRASVSCRTSMTDEAPPAEPRGRSLTLEISIESQDLPSF